MVIYLATPMVSTQQKDTSVFSEKKWARNRQIRDALTQAGFDIFLPQDDADQKMSGKEIWAKEREIIQNCDFLILALSDTRGIYLEAGYAKALGKKVYAVEVEETRAYSEWLSAFCDYIAKDTNDLVAFLKARNGK